LQEFRSQRIQEFGDFAGEKLVFGFSEKTLLPYSATPATSDFLTPLLDPCQGWELKGTESPEVNKPSRFGPHVSTLSPPFSYRL